MESQLKPKRNQTKPNEARQRQYAKRGEALLRRPQRRAQDFPSSHLAAPFFFRLRLLKKRLNADLNCLSLQLAFTVEWE